VDTVTIHLLPGLTIKQFTAVDVNRYEFFGHFDVGTTLAEVRRAAKKWQSIDNTSAHIAP